MTKILLAEDDVALGETVVEWLQRDKYFVDWERDGAVALDMLMAYEYDVVLLDWQLPGMEGPQICRQYRGKGGVAPILFLTDRGTVSDKEVGFDSGADDYLPKPFDLKELSLRVRALLRRHPIVAQKSLRAGPFELKQKEHEFFREGKLIKLSPTEFALMEFLMKNEDTVFSADAILDRVWPGSSERSADTLKTFIKRLREKIDGDDKESTIKNVYGVGYKFKT
ncbi:MAG: response regulator transcription factor [Cyanobacteria bacterium SZAS TMP-1]|nr:response regulator transcription factor [Cyanobacteria bacterium SZAS TMP-1]